MKENYLCPHCRSFLNAGEHIVFIAKTKDNDGLLLLNSEIGNYKTIKNKAFKIEENELLIVSCPLCHADLTVKDFGSHFAKVILLDIDGLQYEILFSRVVGEHCTYKILEGSITAYGEHSEENTNFFGEGPKY
jgi:uncharacterized protein YbaR (Trm112 family)